MPPIPIDLMLRIIYDVLLNAATGYHESEAPTSEDRTETRRQNIIQACQQLLESIVGPGDLLDSQVRSEFAKEAYYGAGKCSCASDATCLRKPEYYAKYNQNDVQHEYVTDSPFRDVAHAIVNHQDRIKNEVFFDSFVERIKTLYPNHVEDDWRAMSIELGIIAACCAGVRDLCFAAGIEQMPLPVSNKQVQPALFDSVSDYSTQPLKYDKDVAWGPYLPTLKQEVLEKFGFDETLWTFASGHHKGPTSKGSSAPTTCMAWLRFMDVTYAPVTEIARFFKVSGDDRHLTRGQLEIAAAEFNGAKDCGF